MVKGKQCIFYVLFSLLSFIPVGKGAEDVLLDTYYNNLFLGEKKTDNYYGPLDPRGTYSGHNGALVFLDDLHSANYLNNQIQSDSFELPNYWFHEVMENSNCPNSVLAENMDYVRYLYRLVTMSYLFEGMKLNNKTTEELGGKQVCSITFKNVFEGCSPESVDMKKFYDRVYGKFVNEIEKTHISELSKKEKAQWLSEFQSSTSLSTHPIFSRLHDWCIEHKKNCRTLKIEEIKEVLSNFCSNDVKIMKQVCSERDNFYGLSEIPTALELIKTSNAFNLINQSGMGEECLRRYGKIFHKKESTYASLVKQYPLIYSHLLKTNGRYIQGELFLPGALKEFDMKGLNDFLKALQPPKVAPVVVTAPAKIKKKEAPVAPPIKIEEVPVEILPVPAVEVVVEKPALSEFERGMQELKEKGAREVSLDMEAFRDDFEFTHEMINQLSGPIKKFQTRNALADMKSYDLLGSAEAPVGLIFLRFLMATENHQGLYNIVTVLGDKFYVVNDIEKKTLSQYIQFKNDASTKNRWQIILLKK